MVGVAWGGSFYTDGDPGYLAASYRYWANPTVEVSNLGFRVASIPEPGTGLLLMAGMLGLVAWRRGSA